MSSAQPSSMYMGVPPYPSSMFNGSSVPPYDMPFPGGSVDPYNYGIGNRVSTGSPYRLPLSGPSPYPSASMMGAGGMYGIPPLMDRYGLSLAMGPANIGLRPGFFPEEKVQKKGTDSKRDNDWSCPKCGNVNFSFRTVCNMRKCNTPKPGSQSKKCLKEAGNVNTVET